VRTVAASLQDRVHRRRCRPPVLPLRRDGDHGGGIHAVGHGTDPGAKATAWERRRRLPWSARVIPIIAHRFSRSRKGCPTGVPTWNGQIVKERWPPCGADRLDGTLGRGGSTEPERGRGRLPLPPVSARGTEKPPVGPAVAGSWVSYGALGRGDSGGFHNRGEVHTQAPIRRKGHGGDAGGLQPGRRGLAFGRCASIWPFCPCAPANIQHRRDALERGDEAGDGAGG